MTDEATVSSIVQQGSVSGGVLCSASTAEVTKEDLGRGCQIGLANMKAVTFVDDITSVNTEVSDTYVSHNSISWFSKKKRIPLNVPKCMTMGINLKSSDILPRLKIDGEAIKCVKNAVCLGDQFNNNGTNKHLIEDRVKKGKACIISAMSLCNEVTLGVYTVETLLLLYKSLFLQVVLYNSQAWCNLTKQELVALRTVQMKFLKRIFHAPSSTANSITMLETGSLPIEIEINKRQLNFLHHVLSQENNDPVKMVYTEELKFNTEKNWANEVTSLRQKYEISESDDELVLYTKERWKKIVENKVKAYALNELNKEMCALKNGETREPYDKLEIQSYLKTLQPTKSRKLFHVRAGILDVKAVRKYWYADPTCRLCNKGDESVDHIVNNCEKIPHTTLVENVLTNNLDEMETIADRCLSFALRVKELENPS